MDSEHTEAIQAVVDRLTSYQDTATQGTVEHELRDALGQTDVDLSDEQVTTLVGAIEKADQPVDVGELLG